MCIRDRIITYSIQDYMYHLVLDVVLMDILDASDTSRPRPDPDYFLDSCTHSGILIKLDQVKPVSYTHLRAHETPEHLVCRLLLEKKKKNPYKTIILAISWNINHSYYER
eukprot:TRINITY_DN10343_c0_g1_i4.p1 TRINITY_DN10343_c0_g1~~TRINITY_DN10343_c0_g1_i4.p1  ORF type:complete len:110 (+),score=14.00 TRINITY_DN10343_c0_g1_i4:173-502(+)